MDKFISIRFAKNKLQETKEVAMHKILKNVRLEFVKNFTLHEINELDLS